MFSSIKMEECMKPELSDIFWIKMVAKNIILGSPGTHFMDMRVKHKNVLTKQSSSYSRFLFKCKYGIMEPSIEKRRKK